MIDFVPIILVTVLLVVVATGIIMLVLIYQKKQLQSVNEKEQLKAAFQKEILESRIEIQEQTFNTISREIHDNVGQILSLAKVQLNIFDQSEVQDKSLLADVKESISKAMIDLRDIAKSLNSERIQLSSLPEITAHELQPIIRSGLMDATIKTDGNAQSMQEHKKLIIFRIIQEALHNILKHSQAKNIAVSFCYQKNFLKVEIADDGIGFDKNLLEEKDGLGLQNIVSRAALIGGEAIINSRIYEGTKITIITPYV